MTTVYIAFDGEGQIVHATTSRSSLGNVENLAYVEIWEGSYYKGEISLELH
jgi:hypothetical protein